SISIENPEFYTFTANATSINFSLCGGCSGSGVQLAIFEIPSGSSCGSGSVNLIYGIIQVTNGISTSSLCGDGSLSVTNSGSLSCVSTTVSGLVVGKKYYIMIDGYKVSGVGQCPFTLTFSSGISPLSVELLSFTGTPTDLGNELNWVTNTEKNNDYFEVEATLDGVNFETVGRVKGAGNSTKKLTYSLLDRKPLGATTYYRLKQVDFDGTVTHHDLITVTRTMKNQINLFPNPVNDELTVDFNAEMDGTYILSFVGVSGNVVEHPVTLNKGYNRLHLPTSELAKGFYLLKVADENGNTLSTNKVVKE
ncbi:MAG TPA: T9SS type A sorting domain-containing protein, partial [Taishania sp.]|nr:T9SS type A sorting domain-containing protein [Taishania sp.]